MLAMVRRPPSQFFCETYCAVPLTYIVVKVSKQVTASTWKGPQLHLTDRQSISACITPVELRMPCADIENLSSKGVWHDVQA